MNKKNITIIATGGTIAGRGSVGKSANYQAGTFDVEEIVQSIPQIRDLANLNTIQLCNVDSNDMGLDKWVELRNICHELEKKSLCRWNCHYTWNGYSRRNGLLFKSYFSVS